MERKDLSVKEACTRHDLEVLRTQIPLCTQKKLISCVECCIQSKFVDGLRLLIEAGVPIWFAYYRDIIKNNWVTLVECLMERGDHMDFNFAIRSIRSIEMLDLFLSRGLNINYKIKDQGSLLMFMLSVKENKLIGGSRKEIFHALVARGANIYELIKGLNVVVLAAFQTDDNELLELCVNHNIDLLSPHMLQGAPVANLLHVCMYYNAIKCAQYLLDIGIDRKLTDMNGKLAHQIGSEEVILDPIRNLIKNYEEFPLIKEPDV